MVGNGAYYVKCGAEVPRLTTGELVVNPTVAKPNNKGCIRLKWQPNAEAAWNLSKFVAGWMGRDEFEADFTSDGVADES